MKKIILASSFALTALPALSNNSDAITTFSNAAAAALNFKNFRMADEISIALPSFTSNGRKELIDAYINQKFISTAVKNNASLQTIIHTPSLSTSSEIGKDGLTYYKVTGSAQIQWQNCAGSNCAPIAHKQNIQISGSVISFHEKGRPTFKVNNFSISGHQGITQ